MADADISNFVDITGTSAPVARGFLELANGDVSQAIQLFFENPDLQHSLNTASPPVGPPAGTTAHRPQRGVREDDQGVIHIDSDDDDVEVGDAQAPPRYTAGDEAYARELQGREYQGAPGSGGGPEEVRSPIQGTTETLVGPYEAGPTDHYVPTEPLYVPPPNRTGPFGQTPHDDPNRRPPPSQDTRESRLSLLYRPPHELMFKRSWDEAREKGKLEKKWMLVNVQNIEDFHCQVLNRDIWKEDSAIWHLVNENFVFLQYTDENIFSRDYLNFYFRDHENMESYPHVAIVDPRTGEQVKVWSGMPFPSASDFHSQLVEFLDRYSLDSKSKNPVVKSKPRQPQAVDFDRMTEEEMLEMALQNSLANGGGSSIQPPRTEDPDALTKSPRPEDREATPEQTKEPSRFASISASNPHTEPEHDPAVTTRIQFRHPNGRIIRRFNTQDHVRRLFEWLKAEPMEGKESTEFELKRMPQGQDLIESLDQTIEEAGLKQGTVMIEFID